MAPAVFTKYLRTLLEYRADRVAKFDSSGIINKFGLSKKSQLSPGDSRTFCYFDFGNVDDFLALVHKGTKSIVVDPAYLQEKFGNVQAIYQDVNTMSRVWQGLEKRYKRHIILKDDLRPAGTKKRFESTIIHEAIHGATTGYFGERTNLDADNGEGGADAPEYISNQFFEHQERLLRYENAAWKEIQPLILQLFTLMGSNASEAESKRAGSNLVRLIHSAAVSYQSKVKAYYQKEYVTNTMKFGWGDMKQLIALWGGKADWEGLVRDIDANIKFLAIIGRGIESGSQSKPAGSENFTNFFFKQRCRSQQDR